MVFSKIVEKIMFPGRCTYDLFKLPELLLIPQDNKILDLYVDFLSKLSSIDLYTAKLITKHTFEFIDPKSKIFKFSVGGVESLLIPIKDNSEECEKNVFNRV